MSAPVGGEGISSFDLRRKKTSCRVASRGSSSPSFCVRKRGDQGPVAMTATGVSYRSLAVVIATTLPSSISIPVAGDSSSTVAPNSLARAEYPSAVPEGSPYPDWGSHAKPSSPRRSKPGASSRASSSEMMRVSMPTDCCISIFCLRPSMDSGGTTTRKPVWTHPASPAPTICSKSLRIPKLSHARRAFTSVE